MVVSRNRRYHRRVHIDRCALPPSDIVYTTQCTYQSVARALLIQKITTFTLLSIKRTRHGRCKSIFGPHAPTFWLASARSLRAERCTIQPSDIVYTTQHTYEFVAYSILNQKNITSTLLYLKLTCPDCCKWLVGRYAPVLWVADIGTNTTARTPSSDTINRLLC